MLNRFIKNYKQSDFLVNVTKLGSATTLAQLISISTAPKIIVTVKENDIILFPSKTLHSTEPNKSNNERISISGDITFLSKDSSLLEHLTPSFENWNKL